MTENEARGWMEERFGCQAVETLARYSAMLLGETNRQNLISPSTKAVIWSRHIVDSAQLVPLAPASGTWLDIGSGAGLPGLVAAIVRPEPTVLVEPRRQRAAFLQRCADILQLRHVQVVASKVEQIAVVAEVISARAVAPIEKLLQAAAACGTSDTRWLLPRGRSGAAELAALKQRWAGMFHMKQSLTDPDSTIVILDGPNPR